ncbi:hypothetical protein [Rhodobacter sp. SY28-1]|uniref:hypothetical protein n=1 Tax=Rhodobacter sp. SY28-1 TaxID=2562317 RepID=UPI0010C07946|nr:hypothetical protein [Rhodobacter sp. SY28-1]
MHRILPTFLVALVSLPALAQEVPVATALNGVVNENFDSSAKTGGSRLVGVRLGAATSRPFRAADVQIVNPGVGGIVCVRAISRDGLYWMRTPYEADSDPGDRLRLQPFTAELGDQLQQFDETDIGIVASLSTSADCLDDVAVVLPALIPGGNPTRIEIMANSGNRNVSVRLEMGAGPFEEECIPPENEARIAFDRICGLNVTLGQEPMEGTLLINFDDGLGVETETYTIRLPAKP